MPGGIGRRVVGDGGLALTPGPSPKKRERGGVKGLMAIGVEGSVGVGVEGVSAVGAREASSGAGAA